MFSFFWCAVTCLLDTLCGVDVPRQGIEKALQNMGFLPVFGGESESGLKGTWLNLRLFPLFLVVAFFVSFVWAECGTLPNSSSCCSYDCNPSPYECSYYGSRICQRLCYQLPDGRWGVSSVSWCDTQAEADSVKCANNPSDPSCGPQNDTETKDQLEERCNAIGGVPHYDFNELGNVTGWCDICQTDSSGNYTNIYVNEQYKEYKESCCQAGHAPNKSNFKCNSTKNGCAGANCVWFETGVKGGGIGYSELGYTPGICEVSVTTNIDGTIQGCEDDEELVNSSDSQNSSSSGESSPSSSAGEGSSASAEENLQAIADAVAGLMDSLHKIIVIDSTNRKYDSLVSMYTSTIASILDEMNQKETQRDTIINNVNVQGDTNIINVHAPSVDVDVQGIIDEIVKNARVDSANGVTLDSILKCLSDRGADCYMGGDSSGVYNDSNVLAALAGIDSALTDTAGAGNGADTAGAGGWLDSLSSWLDSLSFGSLFGGSGSKCDTTGGKQCNMAGSLDSAAGGLGAMGDSLTGALTGGAIGDSLEHWENQFLNNGVITGSGSNSCPSVLGRNFHVTIKGNVGYDFTLGKYLCATIPSTNITFWTLCRVVLRAMVAISCMWWLYRAVTGTDSSGGDDD